MTAAATRRALFGRFRSGPVQHRPPWARPEEEFAEACTQCGKCGAACPTKAVVAGRGGYPIVDFTRAGCSFCGACVEACEDGCFARGREHAPWRLKAAISSACVELNGVSCRMCEEACATRAIRFRPRLGGGASPTVDAARCTGCGACVAPCPVKAVAMFDGELVEGMA